MKKVFSTLAALALIAPSVAAANAPAKTTTQALSIKNAAIKPVRASAKSGDAKLAPAVIIGVIATVAIIGGAVALANNDDTPDSR